VSFTIGDFGYLGLGNNGSGALNDFWKYNPQTDTWSTIAPFPGAARAGAAAVVINGKAYVGLGGKPDNTAWYDDWYEYDPNTNTWTPKASCLSGGRKDCAYFGFDDIDGGTAYILMGSKSSIIETTTEVQTYKPSTNTWTEVNNILMPDGIPSLAGSSSFKWNNKGYIAGGKGGSEIFTRIFEFDPNKTVDFWVEKLNNTSMGLQNTAFALGDKAYVCYGDKQNLITYNFLTNTGQSTADPLNFMSIVRKSNSFVINDAAYFMSGIISSDVYNKKVFALVLPVGNQETKDLKNLSLSPNPSTDQINIIGQYLHTSMVQFQLCDAQGQVQRTQKEWIPAGEFNVSLDVSSLPMGVYLLNIKTSDGLEQKKVIIAR
jgi:N-acetylneuraminic acid mutarotase